MARRASSTALECFLSEIFLYASFKPSSLAFTLAASLKAKSFYCCSLLKFSYTTRFFLASSIFDASWIKFKASLSFLAKFVSLLNSSSYTNFILLSSSRSLSSATDISIISPWFPASVGSNPWLLWIGTFSSSRI